MQQQQKGFPLAGTEGWSKVGLDGTSGRRGTLYLTSTLPCKVRGLVSSSSVGYTGSKTIAWCF